MRTEVVQDMRRRLQACLREVLCARACAAAVREAFVRLHDKGLVYRGSYLVNWSPAMQTAVSDLEARL